MQILISFFCWISLFLFVILSSYLICYAESSYTPKRLYNVINFHRPTWSQNISEFPCTMNLIIDCAARHAELFTGTLL